MTDQEMEKAVKILRSSFLDEVISHHFGMSYYGIRDALHEAANVIESCIASKHKNGIEFDEENLESELEYLEKRMNKTGTNSSEGPDKWVCFRQTALMNEYMELLKIRIALMKGNNEAGEN